MDAPTDIPPPLSLSLSRTFYPTYLSFREPNSLHRQMHELLESYLRHKSDMVNYEAARAICEMKNVTASELSKPISGASSSCVAPTHPESLTAGRRCTARSLGDSIRAAMDRGVLGADTSVACNILPSLSVVPGLSLSAATIVFPPSSPSHSPPALLDFAQIDLEVRSHQNSGQARPDSAKRRGCLQPRHGEANQRRQP